MFTAYVLACTALSSQCLLYKEEAGHDTRAGCFVSAELIYAAKESEIEDLMPGAGIMLLCVTDEEFQRDYPELIEHTDTIQA